MVFAIKGQTKATAAFKGNFAIYGPILFKLCMEVAYYYKIKIGPKMARLPLKAAAAFVWPLIAKAM